MICTCNPMLSGTSRNCPAHGVPDRSTWTLAGVGDVEVCGHSPAMVWFSIVGSPTLPQQKLPRAEFLKKARRCE